MNYEDFLALAQSRRSVRKFAARPVSRRDLFRVLEAARWAPSNHNRQPWRFLVIEDRSKVAKLAQQVEAELSEKLKLLPAVASGYVGEFARHATFFSNAPVVILALHKLPVSFASSLLKKVAQPELVSGEPLSTAMAVQNLLLAAHSIGLGACVLTAPLIAQDAINCELSPPAGYAITGLIALGYADEDPLPPRRKSIEQIAEFTEDAAENR
jgi:nitroreductase